ncbi:hypothetical protein VY87_03875 [Brucella melitensis]|uniref:hypothetical protein n=1 Tax=Brucella melitensis TaxID=29459 RepID=UPI00081C1EC6|nr:hypothetical protein [Brucella melitensis]OCW12954.1 hypothetical protein VY87_03875 [Brucella melitensis]
MAIIFTKKSRLSFILAAVAATGIVAGGTTTQPVQPCTPKERSRLVGQIAPTKARLDRNRKELARVHAQITRERCIGGAFSPKVGSSRCSRLEGTADRLQSEIKMLEDRLTELNAVIAGRGSSSVYVQSCTASWISQRKIRKKVKEPTKNKAPARRIADKATEPAPAELAMPAYTSPAVTDTHPVAYTPSSNSLSDSLPAPAENKAQPVTVAPPPERPYVGNSNVRVVGSSFFPDQPAPANQPVPAHAPAP